MNLASTYGVAPTVFYPVCQLKAEYSEQYHGAAAQARSWASNHEHGWQRRLDALAFARWADAQAHAFPSLAAIARGQS